MTPLLALFSFLYGVGIRIRVRAYGGVRRKSLPGFVVSVGNLTAGGTGKTPAACMLAEWALGEGYGVAILSRGYGGHPMKQVLEVTDGHGINPTPAEAGDEPFLLAQRLRGVPIFISKSRYQAGLLAHKKYRTNFYILDDGFQHLPLKRDLDLVLMDARSPFGNGHLLPWGPLREPPSHLKRADAFVITRSGQRASEGVHDSIRFLKQRFPGKPVFGSEHVPESVVFPNEDTGYDTGFLKGKRAIAFAGIARPDLFKDTLINLGTDLVMFRGFRDHHPFTQSEIQGLVAEKERLKADCLLTTEKDWVRLENLAGEYPDLGYLRIKFSLLDREEEFFGIIKEKAGKALRA